MDHSVNQFGPGSGRHRLVERVERGLVEAMAFHQRLGRGDRRHAVGHGIGRPLFKRDLARASAARRRTMDRSPF